MNYGLRTRREDESCCRVTPCVCVDQYSKQAARSTSTIIIISGQKQVFAVVRYFGARAQSWIFVSPKRVLGGSVVPGLTSIHVCVLLKGGRSPSRHATSRDLLLYLPPRDSSHFIKSQSKQKYEYKSSKLIQTAIVLAEELESVGQSSYPTSYNPHLPLPEIVIIIIIIGKFCGTRRTTSKVCELVIGNRCAGRVWK